MNGILNRKAVYDDEHKEAYQRRVNVLVGKLETSIRKFGMSPNSHPRLKAIKALSRNSLDYVHETELDELNKFISEFK